MKNVKDLYGCIINEWNDISHENTNDSLAFPTNKGTFLFGEDFTHGNGFIVTFSNEIHYLEADQQIIARKNTLEEVKNISELCVKHFFDSAYSKDISIVDIKMYLNKIE